jgi:hypothetical protein
MTADELAVHVAAIVREVDAVLDEVTTATAPELARLRAAVVAMLRAAGRLDVAPAGWEMVAEGLESRESPVSTVPLP